MHKAVKGSPDEKVVPRWKRGDGIGSKRIGRFRWSTNYVTVLPVWTILGSQATITHKLHEGGLAGLEPGRCRYAHSILSKGFRSEAGARTLSPSVLAGNETPVPCGALFIRAREATCEEH